MKSPSLSDPSSYNDINATIRAAMGDATLAMMKHEQDMAEDLSIKPGSGPRSSHSIMMDMAKTFG